MGRKGVPVKTNEGAREIKARTLGLAPRIRTALLLVDGIKSVVELERLMSAAGVTAGALQLLLDKGLIRLEEEPPETSSDAASEAQPLLTEFDIAPTILAPVETAVAIAPEKAYERNEIATSDSHSNFHRHPSPVSPAAAVPTHIPMAVASKVVPVITPPQPSAASAPGKLPARTPAVPAAVAVVNLIDLETILLDVTKLEMKTILGVATKLELTPTQLLAPNTVVKVPLTEPPRLPPLAQAEQQYRAAPIVKKHVIPAVMLRMNLMVARAHLANALDQYVEMDGYALKQKVVACESRDELEQLFSLVENALMRKIDKPAVARVMGVTQSLLER
ncbi:MAG TPA: hypothetical protein VNW52_00640 [Burkholderiaceae bacterium]|nr:hypothetical protein [Burkholderiaceae bacterium]